MLLEREDEIARLNALLLQAQAHGGRVVALVGEAGVGKTSLIEAFVRTIDGRARVLRSSCEDLSIPEPLGPLYDLARTAGWSLPEPIEDRSRLALFSNVLRLCCDPEQPTLLVIEDVHWADDATLDFIRFLGRRIFGTNILLAVTARDDAVDEQRRLRQALVTIPAEAVVRMEVPLLSEAAVAQLAIRAQLNAAAVYRATAGNPFFITELVEARSVHTLPRSVTDAVMSRVEQMSFPARLALDIASVFPRRVEAHLVLEMLGNEGISALAECVGAGVLQSTSMHVRFRHEIARRAVEAELGHGHRRAINERVLQALSTKPGIPTARLVHHARQAQDFPCIRTLGPVAAAEASQLGSHREAAEMIQAVLEVPDGEAFPERPDLLVRLANEYYLIGRTEDALARLEEARLRYAQIGQAVKEGDCLRWISRLNYLNGNRVDAEHQAAAAVERLSGHQSCPEFAMALSNQSQLAMLADRVEDTLRLGQAALDLAKRLDRQDIVSHALNNMGTARQWLDLEIARAHLDESLAIALANDLQEHVARAYTNLACVLINWRVHDEAEKVLATGIAYCLERDLDTWRDYMRAWRSELLLRTGRWDEAATTALEVLDNPQSTRLARYPAALALARLRVRRGDGAEALFDQLDGFLTGGAELQRLAPYAVLQAEMAWIHDCGHAAALARLEAAINHMPNQTLLPELFYWRARLSNDETEAAVWSRSSFAARDMPFEQALILLCSGLSGHAAQGLAILRDLGAKAAIQRAEVELRNGSGKPARGPNRFTKSNSAGLTAREMNVLALISEGLSNKRIARELAISAKTVDHHVSAILAKLTANSRLQAVIKARQLGIV